jgi:hypothetical protein
VCVARWCGGRREILSPVMIAPPPTIRPRATRAAIISVSANIPRAPRYRRPAYREQSARGERVCLLANLRRHQQPLDMPCGDIRLVPGRVAQVDAGAVLRVEDDEAIAPGRPGLAELFLCVRPWLAAFQVCRTDRPEP